MGLGRAIPTLGRSGNSLRLSYLLRSVERVDDDKDWPWSIRQAAVYHSFDIKTGRSLWINIKGNDYLKQAVRDDTIQGRTLWNNKVDYAFQTSLTIHMIYIQWCGENWRWFVRDIESALRPYMLNVLMAPVEKTPYFKNTPNESWRVQYNDPVSPALVSTGNNTKRSPFLPTAIRNKFGLSTKVGRDTDPEKCRPDKQVQPRTRHKRAVLDLGGLYSFQELQKLTMQGERIEEALLVIKLNIQTLTSIWNYYDGLQKSPRFPMPGRAVPLFLSKVKGTMHTLEVQQMQLESLCSKLAQGRKLVRVQSPSHPVSIHRTTVCTDIQ